MLKEYRKTATVKAKLFEKGDEDGFTPVNVPYITTLENQKHKGEFGKHYLCVGIKGEKWLVEKSIFESTYEATNPASCQNAVSTRLFGVYDRNGNVKSVYREPYNAFEEAIKLNRQLAKDEYFIDYVIVG